MWFNSKQREEPYRNLTSPEFVREYEVPSGIGWQVVHGCRQLVSWDVGLSPATSATPVVSCHHLVGHSNETAGDKSEEGGDDVKSSCPLCSGLHTYYNGWKQREAKSWGRANPEKQSQFRLQAETRLHKDGIASNRKSECCGEYVPGPCTHRPSHHESR